MLELRDIELRHLKHRVHDPPCFGWILVAQKLAEDTRHDLPRHSELVRQPAAPTLLAAGGQLLPVAVDLLLSLTVDQQREALRELERWAAVERDELLPVELEVRRHQATLRSWPGVAIAAGAEDARVLEDGRVQLHGLFRLI